MTERTVHTASKKRLLLAVYLDLVLFMALFGLGAAVFVPQFRFTLAPYIAFILAEALVLKVVKWSPGRYLLGIGRTAMAEQRPTVEARVFLQESFLTAALGVLLVLEGGKSVVRWAMWTPPQPFFGVPLSPSQGIALAIVAGVVHMVLGALVLRLHPRAPLAVTGFGLLQLASIVASWPLWDDFARETVLRRRDYQGLPVREGEIELAQVLMPWVAIVIVALEIAVVLATRARFRK